jgi:hypothetical protein
MSRPDPAPSSVVRCPLQDLTWIEICLIDTEGNPVKGMKYKVTDSEGNAREGTLDKDGKARVEGLKPGECSISFPTIDEEAWERV